MNNKNSKAHVHFKNTNNHIYLSSVSLKARGILFGKRIFTCIGSCMVWSYQTQAIAYIEFIEKDNKFNYYEGKIYKVKK